jgi:hypothetical protein
VEAVELVQSEQISVQLAQVGLAALVFHLIGQEQRSGSLVVAVLAEALLDHLEDLVSAETAGLVQPAVQTELQTQDLAAVDLDLARQGSVLLEQSG